MTDNTHDSDPLGGNVLSIALICPSEQRRRTIASALTNSHAAIVREYSSYPPTLKEMPRMLGEKGFDAVIIDLEADVEYALELVEFVAANTTTTVMVYTARVDPNLMVRSMRAGRARIPLRPYRSRRSLRCTATGFIAPAGRQERQENRRKDTGLSGWQRRLGSYYGCL